MSNKITIIENAEKELSKTLKEKFALATLDLVPGICGFLTASIPDAYNYYKNKQFLEFLTGIEKVLNNKLTQDECEEFKEKVDNISTYNYLSSIIDSVLFSKSTKARLVLGIIAANYIKDVTIPYEDIIIINALKDLLDEELDAFNEIYNVATGGGKEEGNGHGAFYLNYDHNKTVINTTFSKLINLNIVGSKAQSLTSRSPGSWHGNITSITKKFKDYLDSIG